MSVPVPDSDTEDASHAHLRVTRTAAVDARALCRLLAHPTWLGVLAGSPSADGTQRVEADLAFAVGAESRRLSFSKAALVDLRLDVTELGCEVAVAWRAASFAPLFPVFAGHLEVRPDSLVLDGYYAPPGGGVGLLVDRAFLGYFAHKTGEWFLERLAEASAAQR